MASWAFIASLPVLGFAAAIYLIIATDGVSQDIAIGAAVFLFPMLPLWLLGIWNNWPGRG